MSTPTAPIILGRQFLMAERATASHLATLRRVRIHTSVVNPQKKETEHHELDASQNRQANGQETPQLPDDIPPTFPDIRPVTTAVTKYATLSGFKSRTLLRIGEALVDYRLNPNTPPHIQRGLDRTLQPFVRQVAIHGNVDDALAAAQTPYDVLDRAGSETSYSVEGAHEALETNWVILWQPGGQKTSPVYKGTVCFGDEGLRIPIEELLKSPEQREILGIIVDQSRACIGHGRDFMLDAESYEQDGDHMTEEDVLDPQFTKLKHHGNRAVFCKVMESLAGLGYKDLSHIKITIQAGRKDALNTYKAFVAYAKSLGIEKIGLKLVINAYGSSREAFPEAYWQKLEDSRQNLRSVSQAILSETTVDVDLLVGTMNRESQDIILATERAEGNHISFANLYGMVTVEGNRVYIPFDPKIENLYAYFSRRLKENAEAAGSQGAIDRSRKTLCIELREFKEGMKAYARYRFNNTRIWPVRAARKLWDVISGESRS